MVVVLAGTAEPWKKTPPESVERAVVVGSPQGEGPGRMEPAERARTARRAPARRGEAAIRCRRRRRCEVVS